MDLRARLDAVNRLMADIYGKETRLSALLEDSLDAEQLARLKSEKLEDFLRLFAFGVHCRFAVLTDGERLYSILSARYGLDHKAIRTLARLGEDENVSRERIRQLQEKALQRLRPTVNFDVLKRLASLAAREALQLTS